MDDKDRLILRCVQRDGRITNNDLAEHCGLSASACLHRFRKLHSQGYIRYFTAILDPIKLDRALLIFVKILLDRTTRSIFEEFSSAIIRSSEILECHMVTGGFDYLLKIRVRDMATYRAFLTNSLIRMPGVRETRTYAVLEEVKNTTELPV